MNFKLLHSDLSEAEKLECMQIMRKGNDLMKAWAEDYYGRENCAARLRRGLFKWASKPEDPTAIHPDTVGIPLSVLDVMLHVRTIESKLLFGYVRMIVNLARRFQWAVHYTYLDMDDLLLEGFIALREAIYSFSKQDACFTTYAHWVLRRHLFKKIRQASDQGYLSSGNLKLLEAFHKEQTTLEKTLGYKPSQGTVLTSMNLDSEQVQQYESLFVRFINSSSLQLDSDGNNFYENLGEETTLPDLDMMAFEKAIQMAPLSDMQRELIQAAIRGEKSFRSKIAENHINPDTNKPYSRMSATNMLRKAYKIVQQELGIAA
jgi:RNA polymerase sigma factor (sigma-70 family)